MGSRWVRLSVVRRYVMGVNISNKHVNLLACMNSNVEVEEA